ncbi:ThuA domain-containing protein [Dyadobacter sp. CY323]|uniref:ThuA domain-containing protein n=1 Tax=Dyadobacter sp. CY323 TaxID=2907302 RepID=UPI001F3D10CB|nr:ThuA domain-containing protein [Dyadobacter sp. CY323]MCE6987550.1 ThuA domain-containing protein [Dyadobacter sp. CY323]
MGKRLNITLLIIFLSIVAFAQSHKATSTAKKKIVFIAGPDSHGKGDHEHKGGCTLLAKALNDSVPEANAILIEGGWPKDISILKDADAIVMYGDGGDGHMVMPHLNEVDKLMEKGVGMVVLHFALEVPKETAGVYFKKWIGGYFEINWSVNPSWEASFASFPDHPISRGIKPFSIMDEWYYHLRFADDRSKITPILQALPADKTLNRPEGTHSSNPAVRESVLVKKEMQTLAWTFARPNGGRGFGFTGGHVHNNWRNDNVRKLVLNAIAWSAKIEIPENGIPSATPAQSEMDALTKQVN